MMMDLSIEAQINCVKREIAYREKVYKRLLDQGKMSQTKADIETALMGEVLNTLESLKSYFDEGKEQTELNLGDKDIPKKKPHPWRAQLYPKTKGPK